MSVECFLFHESASTTTKSPTAAPTLPARQLWQEPCHSASRPATSVPAKRITDEAVGRIVVSCLSSMSSCCSAATAPAVAAAEAEAAAARETGCFNDTSRASLRQGRHMRQGPDPVASCQVPTFFVLSTCNLCIMLD